MTETTTAPQIIISDKKIDGYIETIGRRKTSTATVRLSDAKKTTFTVNGKEGLSNYFSVAELVKVVQEPFTKGKIERGFAVSAIVQGGGMAGQAEAIRHGIARALVELDPAMRTVLKKFGHLKRDPRSKERRKFGLKKARKAPQWSKR